jgi:hypothetical protein
MWGIGCTYSTNPISFQQLAQIFKLLGFRKSTFIAFLLLKFLTWRSLELILTNLRRRCKKCITASESGALFSGKAVNRGDKLSRRYRYRDFAKFERSRRYRDHYRCQEKKSRRGRDRYLVFRDPTPPRTRARSLIANR